MNKKVAVILSGCGYLDGAEIRESVLTLLALDKFNTEVTIFAPNKEQYHVVDHIKGEETKEKRNIMLEASRIARGDILDMESLDPKDFSALVIPGGFGVAKNLSTLAFKGADGEIDTKFKEILLGFHTAQKPIGAICIAPAVICYALGEYGLEVTIGEDQGTAKAIEALGGKHFNCAENEIHIDQKNKVVSTPAYMYDQGQISKISEGIEKCISAVFEMM